VQEGVSLSNEHWLDVMYAVQRFVRERLDHGALNELPQRLKEHEVTVSAELWQLAQPEMKRAIELLVPGLMVDFLMANGTLIGSDSLTRWSQQQ